MGQSLHAGGCSGGDQRTGAQGQAFRQKPNVVVQIADHVARPCGHHDLAVLLDLELEIVRVGNLIRSGDPRPQPGEGIEAFADVARVLFADAPGIALTEVPKDGSRTRNSTHLLR